VACHDFRAALGRAFVENLVQDGLLLVAVAVVGGLRSDYQVLLLLLLVIEEHVVR